MSSMRPTALVLATISTLGFGLTACGSSGLTHAELVKRANAICDAADTAGEQVAQPANGGSDALIPYMKKLQAIGQDEAKKLAALEPSDGDQARWDAVLAGHRKLVSTLDGIMARVDEGDKGALMDVSVMDTASEGFTAASKKLGAETCA